MARIDMTVEVCGMSGDGTIAAGGLLNKAVSVSGLYVMAFDSYPAEIRGFGRCVTRTRIGEEEMTALGEEAHALISLDDEQSMSRLPGLADEAMVFFDNKPPSYVSGEKTIAAHVPPGVRLFGMPFGDLAAAAAGTTRGRNLAALGGFAAVTGMPPEPFLKAIQEKFQAKGDNVLNANLKSFEAGFNYAVETFSDRLTDILTVPGDGKGNDRVLLSGNAAIGAAAMDAGLRFYFGYPITPATPIMEYLAKALPGKGGRVTQMEDEIASVGAVLGSFYAGKRAMTATSGPGLALMTELIAHGVMSETPAVIVNAQRGGPSTGLPTKTEQSDLQAAVFGGPGDSARIVTAPSNVAECYRHTLMSFRLAERYQTPVIVLTDFFLDNRVESVAAPEARPDETGDANVYPDDMIEGDYRRYEITESGISPRAVPGTAGRIFPATGLEHSEKGAPDYSAENHMAMSAKRHRKIQGALADLPEPEGFFDDAPMAVGVIAWGSTFGSALEAVGRARKRGVKAGALKISALFPYHAKAIGDFMSRCHEVLIPELNFEGQLANLIGHLHRKEVRRLNRVTGLPLSPAEILREIVSLSGK